MGRTLFVTKGVLRLIFTVLLCMAIAGLGYLVMILFAWNVMSPLRG